MTIHTLSLRTVVLTWLVGKDFQPFSRASPAVITRFALVFVRYSQKTFSEAILVLEVFKKPAIHLVWNEYHKIYVQHLSINSSDSIGIANMRVKMREIIFTKFKIDIFHKIGAFLDPRQKNILVKLGLTPNDFKDITEKLEQMATRLNKPKEPT